MFRFLAKSAIASLIWSKYRKIIASTLILFVVYFIVSFLHDDFLEYASVSGERTNVALSFVLKWAALLLVTGIYYYLNIHKQPDKPNRNTRSTAPPPPEKKRSSAAFSAKEEHSATPSGDEKPDPFARIRGKSKLHSKVDQALKD